MTATLVLLLLQVDVSDEKALLKWMSERAAPSRA